MIKMQNVRKTYPGFDFELSLEIPDFFCMWLKNHLFQ